MDELSVRRAAVAGEPLRRSADELVPGDVIAASHLLYGMPGEVLWLLAYERDGEPCVFVAYRDASGHHDATVFHADATVYLDRAAPSTGLDYSRADDGTDPQPESGRVPMHVGVVVDVPLVRVPMRDDQPRRS